MPSVFIYDNHAPDWADIAPRLVEFTQFKLKCMPTVVCDHLPSALLSTNETWAVVIAAGSVVFKPEIVEEIVDHCVKHNSPLAGHILDRNGNFQLHPQFFCINVDVYKRWARLFDPVPYSFAGIAMERSEENVHDNYTPLWVRAAAGHQRRLYIDGFASRYISWLAEQGHTIVNIPDEIRQHKLYGYPEHNHQDIRNFLVDHSITAKEQGALQFLNYLKFNVQALNLGFYPVNTEPVRKIITNEKFGVFAGVCGGIKSAVIVNQENFAYDTKVLMFDISERAIQWQQWLRLHWNGDRNTIESVLNSFLECYPDSMAQYWKHMGLLGNFDWALQNTMTQKEFFVAWERWQKLDVEFIRLDLLDPTDQKRLLAKISSIGQNSYIWTSNLFDMHWHCMLHESGYAQQCLDNFISGIEHMPIGILLENNNKFTKYNLTA